MQKAFDGLTCRRLGSRSMRLPFERRALAGGLARLGAPVWVGVFLAIGLAGCGTKPKGNDDPTTPVLEGPVQDNFGMALSYFRRIDEFNPVQGRKRVIDNLNRWIEDQPANAAWQPDPLVSRIPAPWNELEPLKKLSRAEFLPDDFDTLIEAAWARDLARWVVELPLDPLLAKRLPAAEEGLSKSETERLATALRLFDWTIRNVQLDELPPLPKPAVAGPSADPNSPDQRLLPGAFMAQPGPGYRRFPWQTLLMGHGDAWERARVFILLCRQEEIDVVMLGLVEGAPNSPPRPWLPAVLVNDRLFLLDTSLGLPIPGPEGRGIATLAQVAADAKLLRNLDQDAERPYPVTAEALAQVVALIDAPPASLSRRMALAESRLSGDDRLRLTIVPTEIKNRVAKLSGISAVQIWSLPFETLVYRAALGMRVAADREALLAFYREEGPFLTVNPLVLGRHQHFRGFFDAADARPKDAANTTDSDENSGREQRGARALYLDARIPDEAIRKFEISEEMQRSQGLFRYEGETEAVWNSRRKATIEGMRNMRHNAAFWLGLTHYDRQSYQAAIDWLQRRTLDVAPEAPCAHGARYNLARAHEAQGNNSAARVLYFSDDSPQRHGNRLRAEWLE